MSGATYVEVATGKVVTLLGEPTDDVIVFTTAGEEGVREMAIEAFHLNAWFIACHPDYPKPAQP